MAMNGTDLERNAAALARELDWLDAALQARISLHFEQEAGVSQLEQLAPPALAGDASSYAEFVREFELDWRWRLVLALALAPHLRPQLLDLMFLRNRNLDRGFTEFGGWKGKSHGGFLPTAESACFLVGGAQLDARLRLMHELDGAHPLLTQGALRLAHEAPGEPLLSAALNLSAEVLRRLTVGGEHRPDYDRDFPARLLRTSLAWDDLVLNDDVLDDVEAIRTWAQHGATLLQTWGLARSVKPGYRALFYGPPGTGKTLTATLIGQSAGMDVYRVDLSMMVSKYIGETEKNLAHLFDQAQHRRWILFFDEADALFGKRTATTSSNDRHANQEVAYLLQRVEDFPGIVILATNLKSNIDDAFARRFQSLVHFPMPTAEQRLRLWQGMLVPTGRLSVGVDLSALAERFELSGGAITNVVRFAAIAAQHAGRAEIGTEDLRRGVARELRKEGRTT